MSASTDLRSLKKRLSSRLRAIPGVAGVGLAGGRLTVYLEQDAEDVRRAVGHVVEAEDPNAAVDFVVGGRFRAR